MVRGKPTDRDVDNPPKFLYEAVNINTLFSIQRGE